jgi:proteasome regulatory subunit
MRMPPHLIGEVIEVLSDSQVVVRSSAGPTILVNVLDFPGSEKLKPGVRVALNQGSSTVVGILPPSKDPKIYGMELIERSKVSFKDIGGLTRQIQAVREAVELPLKKPEIFEEMGVEPPGSVLLYGPPGTGKTLIAKAVAHETSATFIRIVGSELVMKYIGEGARLVREVFALAREKSPSILFIDELDSIASIRYDDTSGDREVQRTMMQLLAEMDGFDERGEVKIVGATNRIDMLDPAILRPGRFDRAVEVPLPDLEARREIFKIYLRGMKREEIDIDLLALRSEGASGADIKAICMEGGLSAIRYGKKRVGMADLLEGARIVLGKGDYEKELVMFL